MTILANMLAHAEEQFDRQVDLKEAEVRATLKAAGATRDETETYVASCRANIATIRDETIRDTVIEALLAQGLTAGDVS